MTHKCPSKDIYLELMPRKDYVVTLRCVACNVELARWEYKPEKKILPKLVGFSEEQRKELV